MGFACVYGGKECNGCGICKTEQRLICEYCECPIQGIYYEIGGTVLCPECMYQEYGHEV